MKIKRFENINENANIIYDKPWTKEKFVELAELKSEIEATEESLFSLLKNYLEGHPDLLGITLEGNEEEFYIKSFLYNKSNPYRALEIAYYDSDNDVCETSLTPNEFEDFLKFLENPDLYNNAKKYNL